MQRAPIRDGGLAASTSGRPQAVTYQHGKLDFTPGWLKQRRGSDAVGCMASSSMQCMGGPAMERSRSLWPCAWRSRAELPVTRWCCMGRDTHGSNCSSSIGCASSSSSFWQSGSNSSRFRRSSGRSRSSSSSRTPVVAAAEQQRSVIGSRDRPAIGQEPSEKEAVTSELGSSSRDSPVDPIPPKLTSPASSLPSSGSQASIASQQQQADGTEMSEVSGAEADPTWLWQLAEQPMVDYASGWARSAEDTIPWQTWHSNPRHISAMLLKTTNLWRFERVLDRHANYLNARHIAIALTRLPKIVDAVKQQMQQQQQSGVPGDGAGWSRSASARRQSEASGLNDMNARALRVHVLSLADRLCQGFLRHLPEYGPLDLSGALRALGCLGYQPGERWLELVLAASHEQLGAFDGCQLSCALWGVATLRAEPGSAWMQAAAHKALTGAAGAGAPFFTDQGLAVTLWSIASIAGRMAVDAGSGSGPALPAARGAATATAAGAMRGGSMDGGWQQGSAMDASLLLPPSWVEAYLEALLPRLLTFEPLHLSMVMCALVKLGYRPPGSLMEVLLPLCLGGDAVVGATSGNGVASSRNGSGTASSYGPGWLGGEGIDSSGTGTSAGASVGSSSEGNAGELGPQGMANVLWALVRLSYRPPREWLQRCLVVAEQLLPYMRGQELALTVWALASLKAEPGTSWLLSFEAASKPRLRDDFNPQALAITTWALARLGHRPDVGWMASVAQASQEKLPHFKPKAQAILAWSMASLKYSPSPAWLKSFVARSVENLPRSCPRSLACLAVALVKHGHAPGPAWMDTLLAVSARVLKRQRAAAADVQGRALRAARGQWEDGLRKSPLESSDGDSELAEEAGTSAAATARAVARGRTAAISAACQSAALPAAEAASAAGFSAQELANLIWAVARLASSDGAAMAGARRGQEGQSRRALSAWLASAESVALTLMPLTVPQNVSNLALATVWTMNVQAPKEELIRGAVLRLVSLLKSKAHPVGSQDLANTLWALCKLGFQPDPETVAYLVEAAEKLLPSCRQEEVAQLALAVSRMMRAEAGAGNGENSASKAGGGLGGQSWWLQLVRVSEPLLPSMTYKSLAVLLCSVAAAGYRPSKVWVASAADAAARASSSRQARRLPSRHRSLMAERLLVALQELRHVAGGEEGSKAWQAQLQVYNASAPPSSMEPLSPLLLRELEGAARSGLAMSSPVLQNLTAALWGLICYIEWKGGL